MNRTKHAGLEVVAVLFSSATLALAQSTVSAPADQPQGPDEPNIQQQVSTRSVQPTQRLPNGRQVAATASPGTLNYVEGQVFTNGQTLSRASIGNVSLQPGSVITTREGYAEVLLTPGSFLRIGHNSEVHIVRAGLADTSIQIVRGAAQVEVDQITKGAKLAVELNNATSQIDKKGLYSYDAGQQTIRVLDGKATVNAAGNEVSLGKGREVALIGDGADTKRSFNEKEAKKEPLYVWSQVRSQAEAQLSYASAQNAEAYPAYNAGWFWNPYFASYGFWPADSFLYSPFGLGFYSPAYFGYGYYGGGYWRHAGYYRPGLYRGAYRGYAASTHASAFQGGAAFHGGAAGFHGGSFHGGGHR